MSPYMTKTELEALRAENAGLEAQIQAAYAEGYDDAVQYHIGLNADDDEIGDHWQMSIARSRAAAKGDE